MEQFEAVDVTFEDDCTAARSMDIAKKILPRQRWEQRKRAKVVVLTAAFFPAFGLAMMEIMRLAYQLWEIVAGGCKLADQRKCNIEMLDGLRPRQRDWSAVAMKLTELKNIWRQIPAQSFFSSCRMAIPPHTHAHYGSGPH